MSGILRHRRILASAGTGKTWQLTTQYLGILLASDEPSPETILASTFTRAAAGATTGAAGASTFSPGLPTAHSGAPRATWEPAGAKILSSVPSKKHSSSIVALSVSTSASI